MGDTTEKMGAGAAASSPTCAESGVGSRRALVRLSWVLGLVLLDLATKAGVFSWVGELGVAEKLEPDGDGHSRFPLIGDWFALMLSTNPGAAFGQLGGIQHVLVAGRVVCVFLLASLLVESQGGKRASVIALGLVLAGAAGNLYDNLFWLFKLEWREFVPTPVGDVDSSMALIHGAVLLAFGCAWCLGGRNIRWGAAFTLLGVATILELKGVTESYGEVRDFIDVYTPQWRDTLPWGAHFPTFNVADSCISVGAVLLLLTGFGDKKKDGVEEIAPTPSEG